MDPPGKPRRRFHFSLKLLLVVMLAGGPIAGMLGIQVKQYIQRQAVQHKIRQLRLSLGSGPGGPLPGNLQPVVIHSYSEALPTDQIDGAAYFALLARQSQEALDQPGEHDE